MGNVVVIGDCEEIKAEQLGSRNDLLRSRIAITVNRVAMEFTAIPVILMRRWLKIWTIKPQQRGEANGGLIAFGEAQRYGVVATARADFVEAQRNMPRTRRHRAGQITRR